MRSALISEHRFTYYLVQPKSNMLISTTSDLMKYVEVSTDLSIQSITPSLNKAENRFIVPILGRAFYKEVLTFGKDSEISDDQADLLKYILSATAPLAMWYYSQVGGINIDGSGIYKSKSETRWNLGEKEQSRLEDYFLHTGLDALDDLLQYLNEKYEAFPTYEESAERSDTFSLLVATATDVQKVYSILHPQVTYRALRESIRIIEPKFEEIMQEFYAYAITSDILTSREKMLRDIAKRAIIYLATARALLTRTVTMTNEGVDVLMGDRSQISQPENARIEAAIKEYERSGENELHRLTELMNAIPPTGYVPPTVTPLSGRVKYSEESKVTFL